MPLCSVKRRRDLSLAAATAAATAAAFAFTFTAAAVIENESCVHGFYLLSYRSSSMYSDKKSGIQPKAESQALAFQCLLDDLGCLCFRRELDHQLPTAHSHAFLVQRIESLLAFLSDHDETRLPQDGKMVRDRRLGDRLGGIEVFHDLIDGPPTTTTLAHDLLASFIGERFGEKDRILFHRRLSI